MAREIPSENGPGEKVRENLHRHLRASAEERAVLPPRAPVDGHELEVGLHHQARELRGREEGPDPHVSVRHGLEDRWRRIRVGPRPKAYKVFN